MSERRSRVWYVIDSYTGPGAGTESQLLELIRGLDRTRFEPSLVVFRTSSFVDAATLFPCPVRILGIQRLSSVHACRQLYAFARQLRRSGARLVHIFFNDASLVAPPFCWLGGARTIVARRDMGFWYTPAILRLLRVTNRFVDAVVANSEAVKANVHRCEGFPLERALVIRNGHDPKRFHADPDPHFRARFGIGPDDPVIGMVANLRPIKRHEDLIRAFASVRQRHPRVHLALVGTGPIKAQLQRLIRQLALMPWVHFVEATTDAVPVIKHIDIGVLSSASEGLSNAILEYLACGKPVVCTNVGGNPELVTDGVNGFLVEVGDLTAMAERIDRLLSDTVLAQAMARRAVDEFHSEFTSEHMVAAHMELYDDLLAGPARMVGRSPAGAAK